MNKVDALNLNALMLKDINAKLEQTKRMVRVAKWINEHESEGGEPTPVGS